VTTTRSRRSTLTFRHPFWLKGLGRQLPPGTYEVVCDDELIEELSFPVYRRVATLLFVPGEAYRRSSIEMVDVDPQDLKAAHERDRALPPPR